MSTPSPLEARVAMLEYELRRAHWKIRALEEALRKERIGKYGPSSERLSNLQLQLLEEEPGVTAEESKPKLPARRLQNPANNASNGKRIQDGNGYRRRWSVWKKWSRAATRVAPAAEAKRR